MKFYRLLSLVAGRKLPGAFKVFGLSAMHILRRRTVAVYIDPSTGCNLRCRMCYFSNPEHDSRARQISPERLDAAARAFYRRALKVQIGCGTEPTLYKNLDTIIADAKAQGVPYISLTTNGQLLAADPTRLESMIKAGLNEITISAHGTRAQTYEYLMPGARFDRFCHLVEILADLKKRYPAFTIRLNFTFNSMNIADLAPEPFWDLWSAVTPDIIQLRPVQNMGGTAWTDYDTSALKQHYDNTIARIVADCRSRNIRIIAPEKEQLDTVDDQQDWATAAIEDVCYCYISPDGIYKPDFNETQDTYESYHRRHHTLRHGLTLIFSHKSRRRNASKKLNYTVK